MDLDLIDIALEEVPGLHPPGAQVARSDQGVDGRVFLAHDVWLRLLKSFGPMTRRGFLFAVRVLSAIRRLLV